MKNKGLQERQKDEAIRRMHTIGLSQNVIDEFKDADIINKSECLTKVFDAILYWLDDTEQAIVREFENAHSNTLVYHVQVSHTNFGDLYSLFYVSAYEDEWELDRNDLAEHHALVYVYNATDPSLSEFGSIAFKPKLGGVVRLY